MTYALKDVFIRICAFCVYPCNRIVFCIFNQSFSTSLTHHLKNVILLSKIEFCDFSLRVENRFILPFIVNLLFLYTTWPHYRYHSVVTLLSFALLTRSCNYYLQICLKFTTPIEYQFSATQHFKSIK